jgi:ubiquinone/menaquinone biosynthesis C-methylase UbiE
MTDMQREVWERLYARKGELWSRRYDDWIQSRDDESVLDIGCGSGKSIYGVKGEIVGIDYSLNALRIARQRFGSSCLVCGDASRLPFRDESFDLVRASYVLGHLDEACLARTIREISRVMKESGRLAVEVFSVRDGRCGRGRPVARNTYLDGDGITQRYFEPFELEELFSGFTTERLETVEWEQDIGPRKTMRRSAIRAILRKR